VTIAQQLKRFKAGLDNWAAGYGGTVEIATDPVNLFGLLTLRPGAFRVCVMFSTEDLPYDPEAGLVIRSFTVVVSCGKSFAIDKSSGLISGTAGGKALYDVLEECRDRIRVMQFTPGEATRPAANAELVPAYGGCKTFDFQGAQILDAYQLSFNLVTQLPAPVQDET
jgi:hypothetical protein